MQSLINGSKANDYKQVRFKPGYAETHITAVNRKGNVSAVLKFY